MKKLLILLAATAIFAACSNKSASVSMPSNDSVVVETAVIDSITPDTIMNFTTDSL